MILIHTTSGWKSPPEEQPPNHYRLLGIKLLENDTQVIADAALKATALLRQYQLSSKADYSQRLLERWLLLKPAWPILKEKGEYDLQQKAVGNATGVADRHSNSNIFKRQRPRCFEGSVG